MLQKKKKFQEKDTHSNDVTAEFQTAPVGILITARDSESLCVCVRVWVCGGRGSHAAVRRQRACVSSLRHVGLSGSNAIISLGTQPPYLLSYFFSARIFFFSVFR